MSGIDRERLRALIQQRGKTPRAVSRAVGDSDTLLRDILSGKSRNPRADTLTKIAEVLNVPLAEFVRESASPGGPDFPRRVAPKYLATRYRVQAGLWYENGADVVPREFTGAVVPDPRFDRFPQWLEEIVGDSINREAAEGSYAHVVDAVAMGYAPKQDHWVVVERREASGQKRERSIKQVSIGESGRVELWPRSTNPRWSEPLVVQTLYAVDDGLEIEIVGLVLGFYKVTI